MDVLAVPNVCGADGMKTSNFALKPLKLTRVRKLPKPISPAYQRRPPRKPADTKDFRNPVIKSDRALRRNPDTDQVSEHADRAHRTAASR